MKPFLYRLTEAPALTPDAHRGLWFERFFDGYARKKGEWKIPDGGKLAWIDQTADLPCGDAQALRRQTERTLRLVEALGGEARVFEVDGAFATGLGLPHPVENGCAWHPTLGVPYLAASGVKGLLRAWAEVWADDGIEREAWFGDLEQAGQLIFFDALPLEPVALKADVMTPHGGDWYELGQTIESPAKEGDKVPGDWHEPVPVPFLVVERARYLFAVAPRAGSEAGLATSALDALATALELLGAGAKTAVGYGRMTARPTALDAYHRELAEARQQQERAAALERMDPLDRRLAELIEAAPPGQPETTTLFKALIEQGLWSGEEAREVARRLRARMIEHKEWRETSSKKNPEKDGKYQRTLRIMALLDERS